MYRKSSLFIFTLIFSSIVNAAPDKLIMIYKDNQNSINTEEYWTPERMRNAVPMDLPMSDLSRNKVSVDEIMQQYRDQQPLEKEGALPSVEIQPDTHQYFKPIKHKFGLLDHGTLNEYFSSQPLVPITADLVYPYSTTGKLFFTSPTGDRSCSGAVIGNRVVVTAAHCLHNGNGSPSGWNSNWAFVPAYRDGMMPYQKWNYMRAGMWNGWYTGGGTVPSLYDYGFLTFSDKSINGVVRKLSDVVGRLGIRSLSTIPNHAHILGYPGNLDNGERMHQVTAQSAFAVAPNNAEYGSDMRVGAGGGPWIQNFGDPSEGQTGGLNPARNMLIGVTSYGFADVNKMGNGSVIINTQWIQLYDIVCAQQSGNC